MSTFFIYSARNDLHWLQKHLQIPHGTREIEYMPEQVVMTWGLLFGMNRVANHPMVLNRTNAVMMTKDKKSMSRILELNGILVEMTHSPTYKVIIFHLEVLALYRKQVRHVKDLWEELIIDEHRHLHRTLIKLSTRAIYSAGLDYGEVLLDTDSEGKAYVIDVEPYPRLDHRIGYLFATAMNDYHKKWTAEIADSRTAVIGTDLEFVLSDEEGNVHPASLFLGKKGTVGSDAVITKERRIIYATAEIRPAPSAEPKQLFVNIVKALRSASRKVSDSSLLWKAGGMPVAPVPLGGHIHLSGILLSSFLLRALDYYLALPLLLIEDVSTKRRRHRYGFLGDHRLQSHGGFEYRTLPSWIVSPSATRGVLALVCIISRHYKQLTQYQSVEIENLLNDQIQAYYYEGNKEKLLPVVQALWKELEQTETYAQYKQDLKSFKRQWMSLSAWHEERDIRIRWRLPPYHHESP